MTPSAYHALQHYLEYVRFTYPGGWIAVRELDHSAAWFYEPTMARINKPMQAKRGRLY